MYLLTSVYALRATTLLSGGQGGKAPLYRGVWGARPPSILLSFFKRKKVTKKERTYVQLYWGSPPDPQ